MNAGGASLGWRFFDSVAETISKIEKFPLAGPLWESDDPRLIGVRRELVIGFPNHLLFYRVNDEDIFVLRILHGARDLEADVLG